MKAISADMPRIARDLHVSFLIFGFYERTRIEIDQEKNWEWLVIGGPD